MKKLALCTLLLVGCADTKRTVISPVDGVVMRNATGFTLLLRDPATGDVQPRDLYAEDVRFVFDLGPDTPLWIEYVDAPGEWRGEADRLVIHAHAWEEIDTNRFFR